MRNIPLTYKALPIALALLFTLFLSWMHTSQTEIPEVKIGTQVWMQLNLNTDTFQNGDAIDQAQNAAEWSRCGDEKRPCWTYYDFNSEYGAKYGKLYNWYAVNDPRKLAPKGWRIPDLEDWNQLLDYLGGSEVAGNLLKCNNQWPSISDLENSFGFTALPGGFINGFGNCFEAGIYAYWWTATEVNELLARSVDIYDEESRAYISRSMKKEGLSVRCVKE